MKTRLFAVAHFAAALLSAVALTFVLSIATSLLQPVHAAEGDLGHHPVDATKAGIVEATCAGSPSDEARVPDRADPLATAGR